MKRRTVGEKQRDRQRGRERDSEIDRQTDREIETEADRQRVVYFGRVTSSAVGGNFRPRMVGGRGLQTMQTGETAHPFTAKNWLHSGAPGEDQRSSSDQIHCFAS